jgi:hypothetical protein
MRFHKEFATEIASAPQVTGKRLKIKEKTTAAVSLTQNLSPDAPETGLTS